MMHKVLVITQDEFKLGFQLAGVRTQGVKNSEEAREKLMEQFNSQEYGIILMDEGLTRNFDAKLKQRVFSSDLPLILLMPLKRELKEKISEDEFLQFISSAIGYRIRIR